MPHLIYLRKSRADLEAEARGEGETFARHQSALLALAARAGLTVTEIYKEIVSGETIAARPVMQQLLEEVERGLWQGVLVMEVERLARGDTIDQGIVAQAFKISNTKIITPLKTYDPQNEFDEEYFEFGLFMSRREYKAINRRMQRGRLASVGEGNYIGSLPPYGYTKAVLPERRGYTLIPHPEQAPIVEMIFHWFTQGEAQADGSFTRLGCGLLCTRLNQMGIPTARGSAWVGSTILAMLRNPVYIGKIRWGERAHVKVIENGTVKITRPRGNENAVIVPGHHPAIVDEEVWQKAQELLSHNPARPGPKQAVTQNPLAGLIECSICGRKMVRRPYPPGKTPDTLICSLPHCQTVSSYLSVVETRIMTGLKEWLQTYELGQEAKGPDTEKQNKLLADSLIQIDNKLKSLQKQLHIAHDLVEQGVYDVETFLTRSKALNEEIEQQTAKKQELQALLEKMKTDMWAKKQLIPQIKHVLETYPVAQSPEEKNLLLKSVLNKGVYTKLSRSPRNGTADNFDLVLFPKLPAR